ncbi:MAG: V-type ATP synthase subunit E [Bacillota bacterium]|nr:V-type ATP synthase subunit E [Bacillota bacterium]
MALSNIIERINGQAAEEAASIRADAAQKAEQARNAARVQASALLAEARDKGAASAESHRRRLVTLASLDLRKQVGYARQQAMDQAFATALERIQKMDDAVYLPLLKDLIVSAAETGDELIVLSPGDRGRVTAGFLSDVNDAVRAAGKSGNLCLSDETRPFSGGVVLVGKNVELNCTFESTLKLIRDDIEPEVASILFGEGKPQ